MEPTTKKKINKRAIIAVGITCLIGWTFSFLTINIFREYAVGLFICLPLVMGAISTMLYGYHNTNERRKLFAVSSLNLGVFCLGLLFFAWEGVICLLMALPIGFFFTWIGHLVGSYLIKRKLNSTPTAVILFFLSVPGIMAFENRNEPNEEIRSITTSIEINASPEIVWEDVVSFPQLKDPTEFIFKTGIAYPINATIDGSGAGAIKTLQFFNREFY